MNKLVAQIEDTLLPGMRIPSAFQKLFQWIEQKGYYVDQGAKRIGLLFPEDQLKAGWTEKERPGGTTIEFSAEGNINLHYWFGHSRYDVLDRLCVFAQTGGDGSMAAFWLDENNQQKIVHLGSGSGSCLCCVLAEDPVDFLRLLAIGYDEICWEDEFSAPPNDGISDRDTFIHPNLEFQQWVKTTFNTSIPKIALEVVEHPASMDDVNSPDAFCRWVEKNHA